MLLGKYHAIILMTDYKKKKQQLQQQHLHLLWGNSVSVYVALQDLLVFILSVG